MLNHKTSDFPDGPPPEPAARTTIGQKSAPNKSTELTLILPDLSNQKTSSRDPEPKQASQEVAAKSKPRPYPKHVFFIIGNEFCERFSYYGLRTVLVLYFKHVLGYQDSTSAISFHLFAALCYITPILGAILGDSIWGRFNTILRLSCVYFIGELVLVISSILWYNSLLSQTFTITGLILIGLGTGGIKPCVNALGGDQFLANETGRRQTFFSIFYASINLGSLISMFLTPVLRSQVQCLGRVDCYPLAFGVPCALMLVSILVFLMARNRYHLVPLPDRNVTVAFCQCITLALKRKIKGYKPLTSEEVKALRNADSSSTMEHTSSSSLSQEITNEEKLVNELKTRIQNHVMKKSDSITDLPEEAKQGQWTKRSCSVDNTSLQHKTSPSNTSLMVGQQVDSPHNHWLYLASDHFDTNSIEDFRSVLRTLVLFLPLPMYWCLFDQQGSLWTLQATRMNGRIFSTSLFIQPDQISVANPFLLLLSIPLFEIFIYPSLKKCNILTKSVERITAGGLLAALTFVILSIIELQLQAYQPATMPPPGHINLVVVNGLGTCTLDQAFITSLPQEVTNYNKDSIPTIVTHLNTTHYKTLRELGPLESGSLIVSAFNTINNYQLNFRLKNTMNNLPPLEACPLSSEQNYQINFILATDSPIKLLYLEQANGQLNLRIFNDSMNLPEPGKAQVKLIYEFFGSSSQASKLNFSLVPAFSQQSSSSHGNVQYLQFDSKEGQVIVSHYKDVPTPSQTNLYKLSPVSSETDNILLINEISKIAFSLDSGTRNLIILHQKNATSVVMKHDILLDNSYQLSIMWQLIPYLMISMSEVLFSITVTEFSYSMAPETMKSLTLGCMSLTVAIGNLFTVAIESMHLFSNLAHDFLFYATLMLIDIIIFALMALSFTAHKATTQ